MASVIQPAISKQLDALQQKLLASGKLQPWTAFQVNITPQALITSGSGIQANRRFLTATKRIHISKPPFGMYRYETYLCNKF